jgi:hypothetical protein
MLNKNFSLKVNFKTLEDEEKNKIYHYEKKS